MEARGLLRCPKPNSSDFKQTTSHNKVSVRPTGWNSNKEKKKDMPHCAIHRRSTGTSLHAALSSHLRFNPMGHQEQAARVTAESGAPCSIPHRENKAAGTARLLLSAFLMGSSAEPGWVGQL